jgi:predicted 2-oxoglutarate/Fe(II)-dependent dioxygenase YbiX
MTTPAEYFEKNGYVALQNVVPKNTCAELVQHMFSLYDNGALVRDDQCPESDAIYGDPKMEALLENLAGPIGNHVGKHLLPTYAYARIYRPGEVLKKHKDRPACEISATLTLGFNAKNIWPIYFGEENEVAIALDVGEMAVYKGCEMLHWRKAFKGEWHVQVFLHYVDANGPYKDEARDGRATLSAGHNRPIEKTQPGAQQQKQIREQSKKTVSLRKPYYNSAIIPSSDDTLPGYFGIHSEHMPELMFTPDECQRIIDLTADAYGSTAGVGADENGKIAKQIRDAEIFILENDMENRWIFDKVIQAVSVANKVHFDYEIAGIVHGLQLIKYTADGETQGHYDWHVDAGNGSVSTRKISATVQLSDPRDYDECDLVVNDHGNIFVATRERGAINLFPSYMPHRVTPVTRGTRYALVIWVHGSRRFR